MKFQEVIYNKFKKRKKSTPTKVLEVRECAPGDELTRELEDAWILYTKVFILDDFKNRCKILKIFNDLPFINRMRDMPPFPLTHYFPIFENRSIIKRVMFSVDGKLVIVL